MHAPRHQCSTACESVGPFRIYCADTAGTARARAVVWGPRRTALRRRYDPTCKFDHPFAVTQGFGKSFGYNRNEEVHTARWCDWSLQYGDGHCPVGRVTSQADVDRCCTSTNTTGLVHLLVRTVAKSGNLEINFGPTGDGRLPASMVRPLLGTGRWLAGACHAQCL